MIPLGFSVETLLNLSPSEPSRSFIVRYLESLAYLHTSETLPKRLTHSLKTLVYFEGIDVLTHLFFPPNTALCSGLLKLAQTAPFDWLRPLLIARIKEIPPIREPLKASVVDFILVAALQEEEIREIAERHALSKQLSPEGESF